MIRTWRSDLQTAAEESEESLSKSMVRRLRPTPEARPLNGTPKRQASELIYEINRFSSQASRTKFPSRLLTPRRIFEVQNTKSLTCPSKPLPRLHPSCG